MEIVYTDKMSYSTASEKYRKYETLLRNDPSNSVYSRKLAKYGAMLSKKNQMGGNHQAHHQNIKDQGLSNTPPPGTNYSQSGASSSKLTKNINDMIAYAQEKSLEGGTKKPTLSKSNTNKQTTSIKGHRQMTGGESVSAYQDSLLSLSDSMAKKHSQGVLSTLPKHSAKISSIDTTNAKECNKKYAELMSYIEL